MMVLARAMESHAVTNCKAYAVIISRARSYSKLDKTNANAVADWAETLGLPADAFEVAVVSLQTIADQAFNGNKSNAKEAVKRLLDAGAIDKVRNGRKGRASIYATYPTRATIEQSETTDNADCEAYRTAEATNGNEQCSESATLTDSDRCYAYATPKRDSETNAIGVTQNPNRCCATPNIGVEGVSSDLGLNSPYQSNIKYIYQKPGNDNPKAALHEHEHLSPTPLNCIEGNERRGPISNRVTIPVDSNKRFNECPQCGNTCTIQGISPLILACDSCGGIWSRQQDVWELQRR